MATAAFFVALGGTSYAVTQISGGQIKDRSIPGNKLKLGAVGTREVSRAATVPRATFSDLTANLLVPAGRKQRGRRISDAAQADQACATGSLVKLSLGQSCVLYSRGPFTITASCSVTPPPFGEGPNDFQLTVSATSTEAGWYGGYPFGPHPAGTTVLFQDNGGALNGPPEQFHGGSPSEYPPVLVAPDGTALIFTDEWGFLHELADCALSMNAIG
jgi:hypothetical protein